MMVTLRYTFEGFLLLTTEGLYFRQIGSGINVISKESCPLQKSDRRWRLNGLKEVHGRRYLLRTQALELFFADSQELFLNFLKGQKERNRFYAKLRNSCKVSFKLRNDNSILRHQYWQIILTRSFLVAHDILAKVSKPSGCFQEDKNYRTVEKEKNIKLRVSVTYQYLPSTLVLQFVLFTSCN